jgi:hypothetical protein
MANYSLTNLIVICLVGLVIKLFFGARTTKDGGSGPASSTIWGYGISALAIFFMSFINYSLFTKSTKINENSLAFLGGFMHSTVPSFLTLLLLMYLVYLNFAYFTRINQGKVAQEYYDMSKMSTVLIFFQVFTLFKYITTMHRARPGSADPHNKKSDTDFADTASSEGSIIYLLSLINIIFIIILNIILEYFSTDG